MNEDAKIKLIRARIAMIVKQPFFGTLALRLKLIEDATLQPPTAAVDGKNLYYHPDWVLENDDAIVQSMVAHEVGHCIFEHIGRRQGRDGTRWNHAGDYVINQILKDSGFTVPPGWLCNPIYANLSTDQVYNALPPDPPGSAFDSIRDSMPADADPAMVADDWGIAAVQAATIASQHGTIPDSLKRFVNEIVQPKADWRSVLRRFMTEQSKEDYSYSRLNRKFASIGIYLPGLYSERMGAMATAIDTSGSISGPILNAFGAEISEIKNQLRPSMLHVIYCDAAVNHVDEYEEFDDPTYVGHGGGGTDFRPPFAYLEEKAVVPQCFVYLTDGYGPFPKHPPEYPVLWLMTTDVIPPFGEVVRIEL